MIGRSIHKQLVVDRQVVRERWLTRQKAAVRGGERERERERDRIYEGFYVPQKGWCIVEIPIKINDLRYPHCRKPPYLDFRFPYSWQFSVQNSSEANTSTIKESVALLGRLACVPPSGPDQLHPESLHVKVSSCMNRTRMRCSGHIPKVLLGASWTSTRATWVLHPCEGTYGTSHKLRWWGPFLTSISSMPSPWAKTIGTKLIC